MKKIIHNVWDGILMIVLAFVPFAAIAAKDYRDDD